MSIDNERNFEKLLLTILVIFVIKIKFFFIIISHAKFLTFFTILLRDKISYDEYL